MHIVYAANGTFCAEAISSAEYFAVAHIMQRAVASPESGNP